MPQDHILAGLLANNVKWADDNAEWIANSNPTTQSPKVLWIGCSDSRVPESVITASQPGRIFVHRNIANQCHLHDDNVLAVLTHALQTLNVDHVVVVGHTWCGGVEACANAAKDPPAPPKTPMERWLAPLTELARESQAEGTALVELNVRVQVQNVAKSAVMQDVWAGDGLGSNAVVHGWVYDVETGRLRDLDVSVGKSVGRR